MNDLSRTYDGYERFKELILGLRLMGKLLTCGFADACGSVTRTQVTKSFISGI